MTVPLQSPSKSRGAASVNSFCCAGTQSHQVCSEKSSLSWGWNKDHKGSQDTKSEGKSVRQACSVCMGVGRSVCKITRGISRTEIEKSQKQLCTPFCGNPHNFFTESDQVNQGEEGVLLSMRDISLLWLKRLSKRETVIWGGDRSFHLKIFEEISRR